MDKEQLIKELLVIKSQYVNEEPMKENTDNNIVTEFADCLNHPCIENYLLETGIVSNKENLPDVLPLYQSAENIMEAFAECYFLMEDMGLVRLKNSNRTLYEW
jgi:hypothetical protein